MVIVFDCSIKIFQLVNEFLASGAPAEMAPQTFHMAGLLQEMQEIEKARLRNHAPMTGTKRNFKLYDC